MKVRYFHVSNFGVFSNEIEDFKDFDGYVKYHVSPKYEKMTDAQLREMMCRHRLASCRAAAAVELDSRDVQQWHDEQ